MRELKYRFYYKGKRIEDNLTLREIAAKCDFHWADDVDVVEYTGLTDKNETEIYQGDVLRQIDHGQRERYWGVVVWRVTEFVVSYHKPTNKTWTDLTVVANGDCSHWEVVGNIYENPELID